MALPVLKANPDATARPDRRATRDRRGLPARKELPALPGRVGSKARLARLGRKGPPDRQDRLGPRKSGPSLKGSQVLRDQQVQSDPKARRVLPARRGRRGLQAIRGLKDLRGRRGRVVNLDRPVCLVRSVRLALQGRKGPSDPWGLPGLQGRKVLLEASGRLGLPVPSGRSARPG